MSQIALKSIRVLHVDDEPSLADMVAEFLTREDDRFTVETATNANEALVELDKGDFDCIVSDYDMPRKNGIELLKAVRTDHPDIPFILYTGKGSEEVASEAISAGVTDYMQKETGTDQYTVLANRIRNSVEQYHAEQEAERTQQRLRELTESTTDCRWMFTSDWDELLFVSGYEEIWDRPVEKVKENPKEFLNAVHPDDRDHVEQAMTRVSNGEPTDIEYRIQRGDGTTGWVWVKGEPIVDDDGEVVRVAGFTRDVTRRKEREQELEHITDRMEFALRGANAGIWELDPDTETITGYPTPCPIFGEELETFDDFLENVHPDDQSRVKTAIQTAVETGKSPDIEFRLSANVDAQWAHSQTEAVEDDDGSVSLLIGLLRDITERKRQEHELEWQNERLDRFASVISHDLRNPLSVATGRLELAQNEFSSEHLDAAADAIDRSLRMIDDLLELAREGAVVADPEWVNLRDVTEESWAEIQTEEATLQVASNCKFKADHCRLQQLLQNLMRNAVEHGGEAVIVSVGELKDGSGFFVADDGTGIPPDKQEQVFEYGYSTADGGTGLGLSIVQEVVEGHGWEISVTTSSDGGTRFEITGVEIEK